MYGGGIVVIEKYLEYYLKECVIISISGIVLVELIVINFKDGNLGK